MKRVNESLQDRQHSQKSVNGEVALKASLWYMVSSALTGCVGVISTPVFARMMSTEEYGTYSTFQSWYSLLLPLCTLNLTYSIGRAKLDYGENLRKYVGSVQLLAAFQTGIIGFLAMVLLPFLSKIMELSPFCVVMLWVYLFFNPIISFFQNEARYQYRYKENVAIALYITIFPVVISLILMNYFPMINKANLRTFGVVFSTCVLAIPLWIKGIRRREISYDKECWKYGLRISVPLILHTASLSILAQSDRIFISKFCGKSEVAIYSMAYNYGLIISVIVTSISNSWLPWFHDNYYLGNCEAIRVNVKKLVGLGCYIGLGCVALAPEAMYILGGSQYETGVECVMPIVLGIVCQYMYTHYVNIELHHKKTKYVSTGTITAAFLNLILNAVFVPNYGYVSAAYTTLISYIALMCIHFFITTKVMKIKLYDDKFMFRVFGVVCFLAFIITRFYECRLIRYLGVFIGIVSFYVLYRGDISKMFHDKK